VAEWYIAPTPTDKESMIESIELIMLGRQRAKKLRRPGGIAQ
jgi:hypothetical protein